MGIKNIFNEKKHKIVWTGSLKQTDNYNGKFQKDSNNLGSTISMFLLRNFYFYNYRMRNEKSLSPEFKVYNL